MSKILVIFGTRPEAIKLCPLVQRMQRHAGMDVRVCVTAQHRAMLDQVLQVFQVQPDHDLDVMLAGQTLLQSTSRILTGLEPVLDAERPDMIVVQGDTTTTFCGAVGAFYKDVPIAHVEAGLRTGDIRQPFPEEMNRVLTTRLASLHFAPTASSAGNLLAEGVAPASVHVTGNSGIDALFYVRDALDAGKLIRPAWDVLDGSKKLILVTAHRRESFGPGFRSICLALNRLAQREDVQIVYPVHPNPQVRASVDQYLARHPHIVLIDPLSYVPFVDLMQRAHIILTDSGGVQEEAPSFGKPILVLRNKTERPEAVQAGTVRLVGTDEDTIVSETTRLLENPDAYALMARAHNPYGDGDAAERMVSVIASFLAARN